MKKILLVLLAALPLVAAEETLLQKALAKHSALKTLHVQATTKAPGYYTEDSELWVERPGKLVFASTTKIEGEETPLETRVVSANGQTTVWSSALGPQPEAPRNAYYKVPTPADVLDLEGTVRLGPQQTVLRLMSGDPHRFTHNRFLRQLGADQLELRSQDKKYVDLVKFDTGGLVQRVTAFQDGKQVATADITYLGMDQPIDKSVFELKLPAGAKEVTLPSR